MPRDEVVHHLESYATSFAAPVRQGVDVTSLDRAPAGGFALTTGNGMLHADRVVLATGAYQRAHRPSGAATLPGAILQIDAESYSNEATLPPGKVLVVGSGQTGCQLAEELREAGRDVFLACGRAPWCSRRIGGHDVMYWTVETGWLDEALADVRSPSARLIANMQATGHGGGHDLHYRVLRQIGVTLVGHFRRAEGGRAHFACDLAASVAFGDQRYREIREKIATLCSARGIAMPEMPDPTPFDARAPENVDLAGFGAVIFTSGFRPDYSSWVHLDAFDEMDFPIHRDGASTVVPGLYFCGVHFLRTRKSSLLVGVGEDATIVARKAAHRGPIPASQ
jgi:putative flavoprotein involved in K+ transport